MSSILPYFHFSSNLLASLFLWFDACLSSIQKTVKNVFHTAGNVYWDVSSGTRNLFFNSSPRTRCEVRCCKGCDRLCHQTQNYSACNKWHIKPISCQMTFYHCIVCNSLHYFFSLETLDIEPNILKAKNLKMWFFKISVFVKSHSS